MARVLDLSQFVLVPKGADFTLGSDDSPPRKVKVQTSAMQPTAGVIAMASPYGGEERETRFAVKAGFDVVEFFATGQVALFFQGDVMCYSRDDIPRPGVPESGEPSFTKIANRKARNLEMEWMQYKMEQNQLMRFAALDAEYEARINKLERGQYDRETGEEGRAGQSPDDDYAVEPDKQGAPVESDDAAEGKPDKKGK